MSNTTTQAFDTSVSSLADLAVDQNENILMGYVDPEFMTETKSAIGMTVDLTPINALCIVYSPWDIDSILSTALLTTKLKERRKIVVVSSDKVQTDLYAEYLWVGCKKASYTTRKDVFKKPGFLSKLFGKKNSVKATGAIEHVFIQKPTGQQANHIQESMYSLLLRKYNCATKVSNIICDAIAGFYTTQSNMSLTVTQLVTLWIHYRLAMVVLAKEQQLTGVPGYSSPYREIEDAPGPSSVHSWEMAMRQIRLEMQGSVTRERVNNGKRMVPVSVTNWGTQNYPWKARLLRMMDVPHVNYVFTPQGVVVDTNLPGLKIKEMIHSVNVLHSQEI